jgi:hypothetical protein
MGADPYFYVVDFQEDIQAALDELREREFQAGRYRPAVESVDALYDSPTEMRPGPGAQHESIEAIFEEAAEQGNPDGTASILDLWTIGDRPAVMTASGLTDSELDTYFGTDQPTVEAVNDNDEFWADIERGSGRYVIVYEDGKPSGICFAGYSFD